MREKEFLPLLNDKFGISELNTMQQAMLRLTPLKRDIILLSPTGSGKTVAFTLPMLKFLNVPSGRVQCVIIAPSRELVMQIAGVVSMLAPDYKVTPLYGGHKVEDEVNSLSAHPDIVVATPGRLLDHINRRNVDVLPCRIVIFDEFDKSLELGFEDEMGKIMKHLKNVSRFILTSATRSDSFPDFLRLTDPVEMDYLGEDHNPRSRMQVKRVVSDSRDKLESLVSLLHAIYPDGNPKRTIIFVNHRESAERVADFLRKNNIDVSLYHGALDQHDRETALALFNNGAAPVLVATDLAARGLDIEGVESVIHYHQPLTEQVFTHRNGRTARVDASGDIYLLLGPDEEAKPYVEFDSDFEIPTLDELKRSSLRSGLITLYISAGKKEKLSRGDILGFLVKECGLDPSQVGKINSFDHYSLVAVDSSVASKVERLGSNLKIKGAKRKVGRVIKN